MSSEIKGANHGDIRIPDLGVQRDSPLAFHCDHHQSRLAVGRLDQLDRKHDLLRALPSRTPRNKGERAPVSEEVEIAERDWEEVLCGWRRGKNGRLEKDGHWQPDQANL
jgi:hypothetical protein